MVLENDGKGGYALQVDPKEWGKGQQSPCGTSGQAPHESSRPALPPGSGGLLSTQLCFLCTAQVHSGQFPRYSTRIQSMHGELCISSEELLSGYDTLGTYKLSQIPGSHG